MKKLFTLALAVALAAVFTAPAMATDSRLISMGSVNNYVEDDYNIFTWYGTLPSYQNIVVMSVHSAYVTEFGGWQEELYFGEYPSECSEDYFYTMLGGTYAIGEDGGYGVLGLWFFRHTAGLNPGMRLMGLESYNCMMGEMEMPWPGFDIWSGRVYNKFTVQYGYEMEGMTFGLMFSRSDQTMKMEASSVYSDPDTTIRDEVEYEYHVAFTTIGAGATFDIGEDMTADVAFDITLASQTGFACQECGEYGPCYYYEDEGWGDVSADANKMYGFRGRVFYEFNEEITFVPYFGMKFWDFSLKADSAWFNDEAGCYDEEGQWGNKGMMFDFGIGANIKVNDDNLIVFAIEPFSYGKVEPSEIPEEWLEDEDLDDFSRKITYRMMPRFRLALESDVKDWLTFRTGCTKSLVKWEFNEEYKWLDEDEEGSGEFKVTETSAPFQYFIGLGFHIADFDIDCVVNPHITNYLGYYLHGKDYDSDGPPMFMVTGVYHY